ncbi:protein fem-1 homolog B-like [Porites lutea]|uniref:protein fem-1 homolog B-like n=1 Tax=Porites lutea TaxID=51062 RepID=UPI003CC6A2DE
MYLIDHGADVYDRTAALHDVVHCSCSDPSSCEILSCMIEHGGDVHAQTFGNRTPLMIAAEKGQIKVVTNLIKHHASVNIKDDNGQTALHHAIQCFDPNISCEILSCLIEHGGDVNCRAYDNWQTPLMIAAKRGQMKVVTFLTEHGADLDLRDEDDQTALHYAVCGSDVSCEILSYLIENGAEVNALTRLDNSTPLMLACEYGHMSAVSSLIEHGAKVNLQDAMGNTAVYYALSYSNAPPEVLSRLMRDRPAVNNACRGDNCTPLMIACRCGLMNAVTFLIEHGANMDLQDEDGNTSLHYAVSAGAVDTLLDLGALHLIPVCNKHGLTPLLQASKRRNSEKVKCLIQRPEITKEQKIEALELLGASIITKCDPGIERGFEYIKNGMEERFANPSQPLLKQQMEPFKAYRNRKECQTLDELAQIEGDVGAIVMESLYIRERILGKENGELQLLYQISRVTSRYLENNDLSTCIRLRRLAMEIAQSSNVSSASDFRFMTSYMKNDLLPWNGHPEQKDLLDILDQTVLEYQFNWKIKGDFVDSGLMEDLFLLSKKLISFISKFRFLGETNTSKALVLLRKLCRQDPRDELGNTLLHEIVFYEMRHFWSSFPVLDALKLLLEAGGCDVNAVNNKGNTPLHLAVTLEPSNEWVHIFTNMLKVLFDGGAHHDFVNNDGKTPMAIAQTDEARMILSSEKRKLELKCISARAVKKFGIPYSVVVPKTLEKYISMH